MEKIKRILSLLLCLAMMLNAAPITVGAADGAGFSVQDTSVSEGSWFSVPVYAENLTNLASLELEIYYDSTKLILQNAYEAELISDNGALFSANTGIAGVIKVSVASLNGISGSGNLLWLEFRANTGIAPCTTDITISVGEAYNTSLSPVSASGGTGTVTVNKQVLGQFHLYGQLSKSSLNQGDTVTLTICNDYWYELSGCLLEVGYDSSLFQLKSATASESLTESGGVCSVNGDNPGTVRTAFASPHGIYPYELLTLTFAVIGNADTQSAITYSISDAYNASHQAYRKYESSVSLTLKKTEYSEAATLSMTCGPMVVGVESTSVLQLEGDSGVAAADFSVSYDASVLECVNVEKLAESDFLVINPNYKEGLIKFSYINQNPGTEALDLIKITWKPKAFPAVHNQITFDGTGVINKDYEPVELEYVTTSFCIYAPVETAPTCTEDGFITYTCQACKDQYTEAAKGKLGHDWNPPVYSWAEDYSTCSASWECSRDSSHTATKSCKVTSQTQIAATCEGQGFVTYTASVALDDNAYTDTKAVSIPVLGHDYMVFVETVAPTCEAEGYDLYQCSRCTATEKKNIQEALGHSYGDPQFSWAEDNTCSAIFTCKNDEAHKESRICNVSSSTEAATCTTPDVTTYTATITFQDKAYTETMQKTGSPLGHNMTAVSAEAATCAAAYKLFHYHCERCYRNYEDEAGETELDTVVTDKNPDNHVGGTVLQNKKAATCTATGYTGDEVCLGCGKPLRFGEVTEKLTHSYGQWTVITSAGCTSEGLQKRTCNDCDAFETAALPATGHTYSLYKETVDPGCETQGYTVYQCKNCSATESRDYTAAHGHNYASYSFAWSGNNTSCLIVWTCSYHCGISVSQPCSVTTARKAATCTTPDSVTYTATIVVNGETLRDTIYEEGVALGHSFNNYVSNNDGTMTATCQRCSEKSTVTDPDYVPHTHAWGSGKVTTPATCTKPGVRTYTCSCGEMKYGSIKATGHTVVTDKAVAATCTTDGKTEGKHCSVCGTVTVTQSVVKAKGHTQVTDKAVAATCTKTGLTEGKHCSVCATVIKKQEPVKALGHKWDDGTVTKTPTAEKTGEKLFTCTVCKTTKTEEIPALGICDGGKTCPLQRFNDVDHTHWAHPGMDFAVNNGLMNGTGNGTTFEPNTNMSRAMLVTVLWRYNGSPEAPACNFTDVKSTDWFYKAVAWAASEGVVKGMGDGSWFDPNGNVTREMLATILCRYAAMIGVDTSASTSISSFPDAASVASWSSDYVKWAVAEGIISGAVKDGKTVLAPQDSANRAVVATIMMRFIQNVVEA